MSGLISDLSVSVQSLMAQQACIENATNNIANVNTDGYARRRVVLEEANPSGPGEASSGVLVSKIESLRDSVLELRIDEETSAQSFASTLSSSLSPVELSFTDGTSTIGTTIDALFSSLQQLSTDPTSSSARQNVLTAASNVASAFRTTATNIANTQAQIERSVVQDTSEINSLLQQIATANGKLQAKQSLGQDSSAEQDKLSTLMTSLSKLISFKTVSTSDGLNLTTSNGTALVVGNTATQLAVAKTSAGTSGVFIDGVDVTSSIDGGSLGGLLAARDQQLGSLKSSLDQFAYNLAQAFNTAQQNGKDLNGATGSSLFSPPDTTSGSAAGAAMAIQCALTDPSAIAASSNGAAGDNTNLQAMIAIKNSKLANGMTASEQYASLSFQIGSAISQAKSDSDASDSILQQLEGQRGALSGVSLDEESANLIAFQRAYQAAARVVNVIDELMQTAINMGQN